MLLQGDIILYIRLKGKEKPSAQRKKPERDKMSILLQDIILKSKHNRLTTLQKTSAHISL